MMSCSLFMRKAIDRCKADYRMKNEIARIVMRWLKD